MRLRRTLKNIAKSGQLAKVLVSGKWHITDAMIKTAQPVVARKIDGLEVFIYKDAQQVTERAANEMIAALKAAPEPKLGLATGGTFEPIYAAVAELAGKRDCSFSRATTFNLDEYVGLPPEDPQSYHHYMHHHFFSKVDMPTDREFLPDGMQVDPKRAAAEYDDLIGKNGGIDVQFLGLGVNGHIGFNEPKTPFDSRTHVVELTESTLQANSRYFQDRKMPTEAITMGIGTILESRRVVLVATGAAKAPIIRKIFEVEMTEEILATALKGHPNAVILLDAASASEAFER